MLRSRRCWRPTVTTVHYQRRLTGVIAGASVGAAREEGCTNLRCPAVFLKPPSITHDLQRAHFESLAGCDEKWYYTAEINNSDENEAIYIRRQVSDSNLRAAKTSQSRCTLAPPSQKNKTNLCCKTLFAPFLLSHLWGLFFTR